MKIFRFFIILVSLFAIGSIVGCSRGDKFGEEITGIEITKIKDIFLDPGKYADKAVRIEGRITQECPTGCWFYLKDETGTIYVNLSPSGFAIPQRVGARAIVGGQVKSKEERIEFIGKGVEFR